MAKKQITRFNSEYISIRHLSVTQSAVRFSSLLTDQDVKQYELNMAKEIHFNFDAKMCRVSLQFDIKAGDLPDDRFAIAEFEIETHFYIDNIEECLDRRADGSIGVDSTMPAHLVGMAYSCARGIIFERLNSSPFRGLILPVINPYQELHKT
ncbi:MAG: hypothetical protein IPM26_01230 [Saprospiraceae bacterium]|nr:hypothetical protein [Saprospiraceae bacterium]